VAKRFDVLRSWVRSAAKAGSERLGSLTPVKGARRAFEELRQRRASLSEAMIGSAVAHAPGVRAATVSLDGDQIRVDATFDDGESRTFAMVPEKVRFAPRGAKELIFSLEPPESVNDRRVRDVVGSVAAAIARALWGPVLGPREGEEQALIEREGARLRTDLRSIPAVRSALEGPLGMALDVFSIESFEIEDRALRFKIALPLPPI
jgi:hypothetical protein